MRVPAPGRLGLVVLLGHLLQRLETTPGSASAAQYREVAQRLAQALAELPGDADTQHALRMVLPLLPAMSDVYENVHYAHAGLVRAPLVAAARAEVATRQLLARLQGTAAAG